MTLETARLELRHWRESDAGELYRYASDPAVGPAAGWPPHQSIADSREIIQTVLSGPECYALVLKSNLQPIGCIDLRSPCSHVAVTHEGAELELGYWVGTPHWGKGLVTEAAREMIRHGFDDLHLETIWCGHHKGNTNSQRVIEKLGFTHVETVPNTEVALLGERRALHLYRLDVGDWLASAVDRS